MIKILQPLGTLVLVKLGEAKKKTDSGIILPDSSVEAPREGEVVRVGWQNRPAQDIHEVKPGDTVMLPKFGGTELTFDDCEFRLIEEADLLGVVQWVDPEAPVTRPVVSADGVVYDDVEGGKLGDGFVSPTIKR